MLVGATAWRMLRGWPPNVVNEGDPVLVWGGAGGLGSMAIQIVREFGGIPIAVVSDESKYEFCLQLGAKGVINRGDFDHWGRLPDIDDAEAFAEWAGGARLFGRAFWDALGERRSPTIVFDHPGEATIPTSIFLVDNGGMVVICAGTSGLQRGRGPALPVDAPEALPGIALRQHRAVRRVQRLRRAGPHRPPRSRASSPSTRVGESHQADVRERAPAGQHGDPRRRSPSRGPDGPPVSSSSPTRFPSGPLSPRGRGRG